ncbi:MAG: MFS transporter [Verrucomicrobiota bacterium]|jgi:MFS family permease
MAPLDEKIISAGEVHRSVACPRLKMGVFALAGAHSLATTYFFYYVYFYTRDRFGFEALQNFLLAALLGLVYAVFSFQGGRFAQRAGYFASFRLGAGIMLAALLAGCWMRALWPALACIVTANIGMCFTWPALEALMSEGEPRARLRSLVGIYNITWAGTAAFAYFTGGAMQKSWGRQSMFLAPAGLVLAEWIFSFWLQRRVNNQPPATAEDTPPPPEPGAIRDPAPVAPATFLKMALLANPLAYLAINTILPMIPILRDRLHLSLGMAGVFCSVWLFARAGAFVLLWLWPWWQYRFRFLAGAFALMIACFCAMLLARGLWVLVCSQVLLGMAFGLMYHSSLFYAMDVGQTKGEHGGIHESAIGIGNCCGPALAALALFVFPAQPASGVLAVCLLLLCGLGVLYWMRYRKAEA